MRPPSESKRGAHGDRACGHRHPRHPRSQHSPNRSQHAPSRPPATRAQQLPPRQHRCTFHRLFALLGDPRECRTTWTKTAKIHDNLHAHHAPTCAHAQLTRVACAVVLACGRARAPFRGTVQTHLTYRQARSTRVQVHGGGQGLDCAFVRLLPSRGLLRYGQCRRT